METRRSSVDPGASHIHQRGSDGAPASAAEAIGELDALAREDNQGKMRGLYTDYSNGVIWSPSDITEEQARSMVAVAQDVIDHAGPLVDLTLALWVARQLPVAVDELLAAGVEAVRGGDDALAIFIREEMTALDGMAGMLQDAPDWLRTALNSGAVDVVDNGQCHPSKNDDGA